MTGSRTARRWRGKGGALALAALLLGVLTEQAPHTVHHLLDPQEQAQPGCEFAATDERIPGVGGLETGLVSPADYLEWSARARSVTQLAASRTQSFNVSGAGTPVRTGAVLVTPSYFDLFGWKPVMGRSFTAEDALPGAPRVVVL